MRMFEKFLTQNKLNRGKMCEENIRPGNVLNKTLLVEDMNYLNLPSKCKVFYEKINIL